MGARLLIGARWFGPGRRRSFPSYASPPTFISYIPPAGTELAYARWMRFLQHTSFAAIRINIDIDGT